MSEEDLNFSEDQTTLKDNTMVNFNLTNVPEDLQKIPELNVSTKVAKNMELSMASALSRGSGMSSGNFCLAAENIFSMNEKVSTIEK